MIVAEWLYEQGIGENRAILVERDTIIEAAIEWGDWPWPVGSVIDAKLGELDRAQGRAFVILPDDSAAILAPLPSQTLSEGAACRVEITREPIMEGDRRKWAKAKPAAPDAQPCTGPDLRAQIAASGLPVRENITSGTGAEDPFEAAGWSELLEEALNGRIAFPGGMLHLSLTPAMALFDVDGSLRRADLALAGAEAAARAIRRLNISGSIGIDLPTLENKAARQAAAERIDALLPQPFERTAVNGFGFIQIVRPRARRSLPEMLAGSPDAAASRALLRRAERCGGAGALTLIAAPELIAHYEAHPDWITELTRRTGRAIRLQAAPGTPRWSGHAEAEHP